MKKPHKVGAPIDAARYKLWLGSFGTYRDGVTQALVELWLKQFKETDRDIAARVSECKAWRAELEQRSARILASKEEMESPEDAAVFDDAEIDAHTDRMHDFLHYDPKDKGKRNVKYVERIDPPNERH